MDAPCQTCGGETRTSCSMDEKGDRRRCECGEVTTECSID